MALIRQLRGADEVGDLEPAAAEPQQQAEGRRGDPAWTSVARGIVLRWWRRHPANAAGQLARPLLERYAREQPAKLITAAAGTGALLVLIKPWRLLSITAIIAAVLRTSDVADLLTTLMRIQSTPRKAPP